MNNNSRQNNTITEKPISVQLKPSLKTYKVNNVIYLPNALESNFTNPSITTSISISSYSQPPNSVVAVFKNEHGQFDILETPTNYYDVNDLLKLYNFLDYASVESYLTARKDLIPLLKDVYNNVKKHFRFERIELEIFDNMDLSDDPNLIININTSDDVDSVLECQENFDNLYWLGLNSSITKNIIIGFNFE
jgi:hypothetical protein